MSDSFRNDPSGKEPANDPASGSVAREHADDSVDSDSSALLSRLRLIEDQPLESRASAFAQVHDELQARLESGDAGSAG